MAEIFTLNGQDISDHRKPRLDVIAVAEQLLEAARSGEVIGVVMATSWADGASGHRVAGVANYSTIGRLEMVKRMILNALGAQ